MTERPILFGAPMVRAILDGTKSQTRRRVKIPAAFDFTGCQGNSPEDPANWGAEDEGGRWRALGDGPSVDFVLPCPYGAPGDRLWVRETFATVRELPSGPVYFVYRADDDTLPFGWTPSIYMPRAACRLLLEITDVRVERLQTVSEADVVAEGISTPGPFAIHHFRDVWNQINGARAWDANPWVWAISFKRTS